MDYKKLRDTRNSSNPFAQRLGIFVEEIGPGYARAVKDITAEDANPVGGCPRGLLLLPGRHGLRLRHGLPRILCRDGERLLQLSPQRQAGGPSGGRGPGDQARPNSLLLRGGDPGPGGDAAGERVLHLLQAGPGDPAVRSAYKKTALRRSFLYAYFLKLSFKLTDRLNTRWPGLESLLSRQK